MPDVQTEQLVAHALGELDAAAAVEVERRLAGSVEARETMALVRRLVTVLREDDTAAPPAEVFERVVSLLPRRPEAVGSERAETGIGGSLDWLASATQVLAELVFDSRRRSPARAGFRGGRDSYQLTYASPLGTVQLDILPLQERDPSRWRIRGQLSDCETPGGLPVVLTGPGGHDEAARGATDDRGFFRLETAPGAFDLHIAIAPRTLVLSEVRVG